MGSVSLASAVATLAGQEIYVINCPAMHAARNMDNARTEPVSVHRAGMGDIARCVSRNIKLYYILYKKNKF